MAIFTVNNSEMFHVPKQQAKVCSNFQNKKIYCITLQKFHLAVSNLAPENCEGGYDSNKRHCFAVCVCPLVLLKETSYLVPCIVGR